MGYLKSRRSFLTNAGALSVGIGVLGIGGCGSGKQDQSPSGTVPGSKGDLFFKISLAEWSLHRSLRAGKLTNLEFPSKAKNDFGIDAVEYVNQFFKDKSEDGQYLADLKTRCEDQGVQSLLIMIDEEGDLGDPDDSKRSEAVENHYKWVEAAQFLGCHSIRVNAAGQGSRDEIQQAVVEGLRTLSQFASTYKINVIVENHGGYSSDGQWLSHVINAVDLPNCGTLPDFGNFCVEYGDEGCNLEYDKYQGIAELMPYARGVSAKSLEFDASGNEINIDYAEMLRLVKDAGYTGHIGIEYEGSDDNEDAGILKTKRLLQKIGASI